MRISRGIVLWVSVASVALGVVGTSAASAGQVWRFSGTELSGTEKIKGTAIDAVLTVPGASTTCGRTVLTIKISNEGVTGVGEVTKLALNECHTAEGSACVVESIEAEKLPWPVTTITVTGKTYVILEHVRIGIKYAGALCALSGTLVDVGGTAGGLFENPTSTLLFNENTLKATGTSLKIGATSVNWDALFPMSATGIHSAEALGLF